MRDNPDGGDPDNVVVQNGMYVYYRFDGDYNDAAINAINGFGKNNPKFVEGVTADSKAIQFSKVNESYFNVPSPMLDSRELSVSFWAKGFEDGNIFYMLNRDNEPTFSLSVKDGSLRFLVSMYHVWAYYLSYTNGLGYFPHPDLSDGKWHHIVVTMDFGKTAYSTAVSKLYVDGNHVDTMSEEIASQELQTFGNGLKFVMGGSAPLTSNQGPIKAANITVDNFRVYDTRQLSAQEVKDIYNAKQ